MNDIEAEDAIPEGDDPKSKSSKAHNDNRNMFVGKPARAISSLNPNRQGMGSSSSAEHVHRLSNLLDDLLRDHNWKEASGVLSLLMRGTCCGPHPMVTFKKYWAALEILSRSGCTNLHLTKIKSMHDIWTSKLVGMRGVSKRRYLIQLGFSLFCLTNGHIEEAQNSLTFLLQDRESHLDPLVNLIAGFVFYERWYSGLPEDMQLRNCDVHMALDANEIEADCFDRVPLNIDCSDDHNAVSIEDLKYSARSALNRRFCNQERKYSRSDASTLKQFAEMHEQRALFLHDNCIDTSISFPYGLDKYILPLQLEHSSIDQYSTYLQSRTCNEHRTNAVKHLRHALNSNPPVLGALPPLVQLLLLGDEVDEALMEVKNFCERSNSVLPLRLWASLLERVGGEQSTVLSMLYENILRKDPTCSHSLMELIRMYRDGNYSMELLLEMIALHLDATYGTSGIWEELASCFLKLQDVLKSVYEDDCMSTDKCTNNNGSKRACSVPPNLIHPMFMKLETRNSWRFRCRWWSSRHFCKDMYLSEIRAGDCQLLTFKAASAAHLYDPKFEYAERVYSSLKKEMDTEKILLLEMHFQNSVKLLGSLNGDR